MQTKRLTFAFMLIAAAARADDRAARTPEIEWPKGFDPDTADLFAHNEIQIAAPCAKAFSYLVAAADWPRWYSNAKDVSLPGGTTRLADGARFTWKTFGLDVESRVGELAAPNRLGWYGSARDIEAYHSWLLVQAGGGCKVVTEEVANGAGARALVAKDPTAMHRGHDLWLASLKAVAEK